MWSTRSTWAGGSSALRWTTVPRTAGGWNAGALRPSNPPPKAGSQCQARGARRGANAGRPPESDGDRSENGGCDAVRWGGVGSADAFDDGDVGLAAAFAHGLEAVAAVDALELAQERGHEADAGGAEWVAQGDGAAVDVDA